MRLLAPAKVNLHLRVGPPRADGFHPLLSWMCTAGLFDTLTLEHATLPTERSPEDLSPEIELSCDRADLPCDPRNLVVRVASAWGREARQISCSRVGPVRATLAKRIPAGAGLGGGSSDGARALAGVDRLWNTRADAQALADFAAKFGSDLSFFFFGPSSVCKGRGEIVTPIPRPTPRWLVLVLPEIAMPTPDVYRAFDAMKLGQTRDVEQEPEWNAWAGLSAKELLPRLVNDLEAPSFALAPGLGELRGAIERTIGRIVRMSGSGSSLFTIYDAQEEAAAAAQQIMHRHEIKAIAAGLSPDFADDLCNVSQRSR